MELDEAAEEPAVFLGSWREGEAEGVPEAALATAPHARRPDPNAADLGAAEGHAQGAAGLHSAEAAEAHAARGEVDNLAEGAGEAADVVAGVAAETEGIEEAGASRAGADESHSARIGRWKGRLAG